MTDPAHSGSPVQSSPDEDQEIHFVGFVFDDIQRFWHTDMPDFHDAHLVLFRRGIRSACARPKRSSARAGKLRERCASRRAT